MSLCAALGYGKRAGECGRAWGSGMGFEKGCPGWQLLQECSCPSFLGASLCQLLLCA